MRAHLFKRTVVSFLKKNHRCNISSSDSSTNTLRNLEKEFLYDMVISPYNGSLSVLIVYNIFSPDSTWDKNCCTFRFHNFQGNSSFRKESFLPITKTLQGRFMLLLLSTKKYFLHVCITASCS